MNPELRAPFDLPGLILPVTKPSWATAVLRVLACAMMCLTLLSGVALAKDKEAAKPTGKPRSRDLYFYSQETIPPRMNYMNEAMDSAQLINYIRERISTNVTKRGYRAYNYRLITNQSRYKSGDWYMTVETTVKISKPNRSEFIFEVTTRATLYEHKNGKKVATIKGSAKNRIFEQYNRGIRETVDEALEPLLRKLPKYREF